MAASWRQFCRNVPGQTQGIAFLSGNIGMFVESPLRQGAYIAVGWIVISIAKLFIGDPLTVYLEASHSDAMKVASLLLSLATQAAVGSAVLHTFWSILVEENVQAIARKMDMVRLYDASWQVRNVFNQILESTRTRRRMGRDRSTAFHIPPNHFPVCPPHLLHPWPAAAQCSSLDSSPAREKAQLTLSQPWTG
jgi:hypothetical protein